MRRSNRLPAGEAVQACIGLEGRIACVGCRRRGVDGSCAGAAARRASRLEATRSRIGAVVAFVQASPERDQRARRANATTPERSMGASTIAAVTSGPPWAGSHLSPRCNVVPLLRCPPHRHIVEAVRHLAAALGTGPGTCDELSVYGSVRLVPSALDYPWALTLSAATAGSFPRRRR